MDCQKNTAHNIRHEKRVIKNKNNKNWGKKLEHLIVQGVKVKLQEIKMTNKVLREKPNCVVCWSSKSRFLKQKYNNKK